MENILKFKCGICGSELGAPIFMANDRNFNTTDRVFKIIECNTCGVGQTLPLPDFAELNQYYPHIYYPRGSASEKYYRKHIERFQIDKLKKIQAYSQTGKLLDIGCGVGYFIRTALNRGYTAEGVEFSEVAAAIGREQWNLQIVSGDFLSNQFVPESFDIVTLWQVLEHLRQPREVLLKVHSLLKPGGLLVIAVPNFASIQAKLFRNRWYHLDVPRHLFHYSPESLVKILDTYNFHVDKIDHHSAEHNYAGILGSIMRISPPGESFFHKLIRKTVATSFSRVLAKLETSISKGGTFTAFSRKY
ncbi:MAG: class I SAM-dependent methyltransferase [Bacteroidota bacterium]|nr:class I SAM-dependent methyltransferase [Bacteroidota bacterium]